MVELWMWAGAVACAWRAYGGVVAAMCAVVWVAGPVAGVLSWSSGFAATSSLVLNRESIAQNLCCYFVDSFGWWVAC